MLYLMVMSKERAFYDEAFIERFQRMSPDHDKGKVYSAVFEKCLNELVHEGKISDYIALPKDSVEDENGIDYFLITNSDEILPFSITGSKKDQVRRLKQERDIPVLFILSRDSRQTKTLETIKQQVIQAISKH